MKTKLTATKIAALTAKSTRYRVWDSEIQGFHVRVTPTGKKTFILTYRHEGLIKEYTIGKHGNLTIEEGRRLAKKLSGQVADGIDVHAERKVRNANAAKSARATLEKFYSSMYLPWGKPTSKAIKRPRVQLIVISRTCSNEIYLTSRSGISRNGQPKCKRRG